VTVASPPPARPDPPPGSEAAVVAGCRCPVLDNAHGRGCRADTDDRPLYWVVADCPLHGVPPGRPPTTGAA
jgi:hypothetical protein